MWRAHFQRASRRAATYAIVQDVRTRALTEKVSLTGDVLLSTTQRYGDADAEA